MPNCTLALDDQATGGNHSGIGGLCRPAYLDIVIWEHGFCLDYKNRKPEHIKAALSNIVNW
jgi:Fe-Mn family superoxide dismutase